MYTSYYYFCYAIAQHYSMVLWLGLAICMMVIYIVLLPYKALMVAALMNLSITKDTFSLRILTYVLDSFSNSNIT